MWVRTAHYTQIASSLFIDDRLRAVSTDSISTDSTVVLPKEVGKISKTYDAIWLFLECLRFLDDDVWIKYEIPGKLRETSFELLLFINDLDWGSSLVADEF